MWCICESPWSVARMYLLCASVLAVIIGSRSIVPLGTSLSTYKQYELSKMCTLNQGDSS